MQGGKLPPALLQSLVFPRRGRRRPETVVGAGIGLDAALLDLGAESLVVLTSDPITAAGRHAGWLAVHVNCNDVAAAGGDPVALLVTLLLPPTITEADLTALLTELDAAASALGVEIVGGHTEVTPGLTAPLLVVTAVGRAPRGRLVHAGTARPGDLVYLTKGAGIEGTAILASDFAAELTAALGADLVARAQAFRWEISVVPEARLAVAHGATALHDVTEGGVLGALWELAEASQVGLRVWQESIPVRPETEAICRYFGLDPYALIGSGALLIAAPPTAPILAVLQDAGIPVARIGEVAARDRRLLVRGKALPLVPPERDELWRLLTARAAAGTGG